MHKNLKIERVLGTVKKLRFAKKIRQCLTQGGGGNVLSSSLYLKFNLNNFTDLINLIYLKIFEQI